MSYYIYKGDDTDAFNQEFLTVNVIVPEDWTITKAELKIAQLPPIVYNNPTFPWKVKLSSIQTKKLKENNECNLAIYDARGRKQTLDGTAVFKAKEEVVK